MFTQCLTNSSCDIPRFRWSNEALLIAKASGCVAATAFDAAAEAAIPAKPIRIRRRLAEVTRIFEGMRLSPCLQVVRTNIPDQPRGKSTVPTWRRCIFAPREIHADQNVA